VGTASGDVAAVTVKLYQGTDTTVTPIQTPGASIASGSWSATASHLSDGQYTVVAEQSDSATNKQTRQSTFSVNSQPPVASFVFSPASPIVGSLVTFDGTASTGGSGPITGWTWGFGDGGTGTGGPTITHAYAAAGSYTAQLTVSDGTGTASTTRPVAVGPAPITPAKPSDPGPANVVPAPPEVTPAAIAPRLGLRVARQRLARVLKRGLRVVVSSNLDDRVTVELTLSKRVARRLGLGKKLVIARARPDLAANDPEGVVLRLSRGTRAHLAGRSSLVATLRMTLGSTVLTQPLTLRR
jgi:hypothetical protein